MHRVAFPQAADRLPSAFQKATETSAPGASSSTASWSKPTPRCRSPSARASAAVTGLAPPRASITTKSFPAPCILRNASPGPALSCP